MKRVTREERWMKDDVIIKIVAAVMVALLTLIIYIIKGDCKDEKSY